MKHKKDWNRQPAVDAAGDKIMADQNCAPSEVTAYQIAVELGCSANSSIHEKTTDWCRRRERESELAHIELPAGAEEEYRKVLTEGLEKNMQAFVRMARLIGATMHQSAHIPVMAANRRAEAAEGRAETALQICKKAEADLEAAHAEIETLREQLAEAEKQSWRLQGRLEQLQIEATKASDRVHAEAANPVEVVAPSEAQPSKADAEGSEQQQTMEFDLPDDASS
ncbi:hypothetical protein [Sphingomonas sp.]|uniref:hypothetical protein n=1 Tax=Sphingomonas sp. TaxID=28214 RepID=UPI002FD9F215